MSAATVQGAGPRGLKLVLGRRAWTRPAALVAAILFALTAVVAGSPHPAAAVTSPTDAKFCRQATTLRRLAQSGRKGKQVDMAKFRNLGKGFGRIARLPSDANVVSALQSMGTFFLAVGNAGTSAKANAMLANSAQLADYNKAAGVYAAFYTVTCGQPAASH